MWDSVLAVEQLLKGARRSFVLKKLYSLFQTYSRKGNILSQYEPGFPHAMLSALGFCPIPSSVTYHHIPHPTLEIDTHLQKLIIGAPLFAKICNRKFLPIPQLNDLGGVLFLCEPNAVLSLPLCLSPFYKEFSPLSDTEAFSPSIYVSTQNTCHFSPSDYV